MRIYKKCFAILCMSALLCNSFSTYAANVAVPPITGNNQTQSTNEKPIIQAESAVLIDAGTGAVLLEKNAYAPYFPASITKLMTALLVLEHCKLDETVTFTKTAVTNLESGSVSLNITTGDKLSVEVCLNALLLKSANEVANGLAEHVAGSMEEFAKMMNSRAKELGCTNTNFTNANGLNNANHVTSSYDMALIAKAAFQNPQLCKVASTLNYQMPPTILQPSIRTLTMGHKMLNANDTRYYEGFIGGKTGYTSLAGNTLVTCVERNGRRLIAVVMKSRQTHYQDTKAMLDYGFTNANISKDLSTGNSDDNWEREPGGWRYKGVDGSYFKGKWQTIGNIIYLFDESGYMTTGWKQVGGIWYYLNEDGALLKNTTTPDGFRVGSDGAWIS